MCDENERPTCPACDGVGVYRIEAPALKCFVCNGRGTLASKREIEQAEYLASQPKGGDY